MGVKYIEPAIGKKAFTCPHCGVISLMHFHCINFFDKNVIEFHKGKHGGNSWVQVATCENCLTLQAYPDGRSLHHLPCCTMLWPLPTLSNSYKLRKN